MAVRQPRIPGIQREFKTQGLVPEVQRLVARDAARFGVTESFMKAEIISHHYEQLGHSVGPYVTIEEATGKAPKRKRRNRG